MTERALLANLCFDIEEIVLYVKHTGNVTENNTIHCLSRFAI